MKSLVFTDPGELETYLQEKGVDTSKYGTQLEGGKRAKDVADLFGELESGEVTLSFDEESGKIIRRVQVLNIHILYGDLELYEEKQVFKDKDGNENPNDSRERKHLTVAVSEKIGPGEDPFVGVVRATKEELGIILKDSQLGEDITTHPTEPQESPSFPQIWTIYQVFVTSVELDDDQYNPDGYIEKQKNKNTYFRWRDKQFIY